jgi:hypothetical protein
MTWMALVDPSSSVDRLPARLIRHHQIKQDQIRTGHMDDLKTFQAGVGSVDIKATPFEDHPDQLDRFWFIFDTVDQLWAFIRSCPSIGTRQVYHKCNLLIFLSLIQKKTPG